MFGGRKLADEETLGQIGVTKRGGLHMVELVQGR